MSSLTTYGFLKIDLTWPVHVCSFAVTVCSPLFEVLSIKCILGTFLEKLIPIQMYFFSELKSENDG